MTNKIGYTNLEHAATGSREARYPGNYSLEFQLPGILYSVQAAAGERPGVESLLDHCTLKRVQ